MDTAIEGKSAPQFKRKIAYRLTVITAIAVIIPLLIAGIVGYVKARDYMLTILVNQVHRSEEIAGEEIDEWTLSKSARIDAIAHQRDFRRHIHHLLTVPHLSKDYGVYARQVANDLRPLLSIGSPPLFNDIFVLDNSALVLTTTKQGWTGVVLRGSDLDNLINQINTDQTSYSRDKDPYGSVHYFLYNLSPLYTQKGILVTIYPYVDKESNKTTFIVGISEEEPIEDIFTLTNAAVPHSSGFIITSEGIYLGITKQIQRLKAAPLPPSLAKAWHTYRGKDFTITYTSPISDKTVLAHVVWVPRIHTGIGVEVPQKFFYEPIRKISSFIITLGLILILVVVITVAWVSNRFTHPILTVANSAQRFAKGDWRIRAPVERDDEIGLLAYSFNQMADQLSGLYYSLEEQVETRAGQIKAAAEVAVLATSAENLDEILERTVNLVVERFPNYYHASVFLLDEKGEYAVLQASTGKAGRVMKEQGHKLAVGSASVVGWATQHNEPRIASDVATTEIYFKNPLLPETRAEAAIPIAIGNRVLGALDVQSKEPNAFDETAIDTLHTLASLLAAAIYNIRLREQTEVSLEEINTLYRAIPDLAKAESLHEFTDIANTTLKKLPVLSALFGRRRDGTYEVNIISTHGEITQPPIPPVTEKVFKTVLPPNTNITIEDLEKPQNAPRFLIALAEALGSKSALLLPFYAGERLEAVILLGSQRKSDFPKTRSEVYSLVLTIAERLIERIFELRAAKRQVKNAQFMLSLTQEALAAHDRQQIFSALQTKFAERYGEVGIAIAMYKPIQQQLTFPYAHLPQKGKINIPEVALGNGPLSEVVIKRKSVFLTEQTESLKSEVFSGNAHTWIGLPLIAHDELLGALVIADFNKPTQLNEKELPLLEEIAGVIALMLYQNRQVEESTKRAQREHLLFQMNERLRRAQSIQQIMEISLKQIQEVLGIQKGTIHLKPSSSTEGNKQS